MIPFQCHDPYPLLPLSDYTYADAQAHAIEVDSWLGFQAARLEEQIGLQSLHSTEKQNWNHISVQAMQTPYIEIRNILDLLHSGSALRIVDLGCAYARMAFVLNRHYPNSSFIGYELEDLRVLEAQRLFKTHTISNSEVYTQDLVAAVFKLPIADVYFLFDYGIQKDVEKTLLDLKEIAKSQSIRVVARGRLSRFCIQNLHPWLSEVNEPQHFAHFSIFQS